MSNATQSSGTKTPDFMTQVKLRNAQERWQFIVDYIGRMQEEHDLETRIEEKIRLEHIIQEKKAALGELEGEISRLENAD